MTRKLNLTATTTEGTLFSSRVLHTSPDIHSSNCRKREEKRKYQHDPLTAIEKQLASRSQTSSSSSIRPQKFKPRPLASASTSVADPTVQVRLTRESSERERARALIQRKKKEMEGNMTPSTVFGDDDEGYRDVYNRQEVRDAHRGREQRKNWDRGRRRDW
jgi:hypothetical protein